MSNFFLMYFTVTYFDNWTGVFLYHWKKQTNKKTGKTTSEHFSNQFSSSSTIQEEKLDLGTWCWWSSYFKSDLRWGHICRTFVLGKLKSPIVGGKKQNNNISGMIHYFFCCPKEKGNMNLNHLDGSKPTSGIAIWVSSKNSKLFKTSSSHRK